MEFTHAPTRKERRGRKHQACALRERYSRHGYRFIEHDAVVTVGHYFVNKNDDSALICLDCVSEYMCGGGVGGVGGEGSLDER